MIQETFIYRVTYKILDKKLSLYLAILLVGIYIIFKSRNMYDMIYIWPLIIFYELFILLIKYDIKNKRIFLIQCFLIPIGMILLEQSDYFEILFFLSLIILMYRYIFKFFYVVFPHETKGILDYYALTIMLTPFFIHRYKNHIFKIIDDNNKVTE